MGDQGTMTRPKCKRCGGPLDIFYDGATDRQEWICNSPKPIYNDEEFWAKWHNLSGDDVVRLEMELYL